MNDQVIPPEVEKWNKQRMSTQHEAIIARLHRQIKDMEEQRDAILFTFNQANAECARLRALLTRAADALEKVQEDEMRCNAPEDSLIAELRKEAQ